MGLFRLSRNKRKKVFVLSIDGVSFSLLREAFAKGKMPEFAWLSREGGFVRMNSVIPTISSVAWATFMTGVNPGVQNIYGFVDLDRDMRRTVPTSSDLKAKTLWERLSERGKQTIVINVPVTYPPKPVNGILVSGFLSPSLDRTCYPSAISHKLSDIGYIIDPDPWKAKNDKEGFLEDCFRALQVRRKVALGFLGMFLAIRERRKLAYPLMLVFPYVTVVILALLRPQPRYKLPFLPYMFIFATQGFLSGLSHRLERARII